MNAIEKILKAIEENGEDTNIFFIEDLLKELQNKVVVYMIEDNPCCEPKSGNTNYYSQDDLIKKNAKAGTLFLVDKSKLDKITGDDWNDAPSCCNSGSPYDQEELGIEKIDLVLGKGLKL